MSFIKASDFPIVGESAVAPDYLFSAEGGVVTIYMDGFICPLFILNLTDGQVIYNPSKPALSGKQNGNQIDLVLDVSTMDDGDRLLIVCAVDRHSEQKLLTQELIRQQELTNFLLKGIVS